MSHEVQTIPKNLPSEMFQGVCAFLQQGWYSLQIDVSSFEKKLQVVIHNSPVAQYSDHLRD